MLRLILLVGLTLLVGAGSSQAAPVTWTGATSTDWHNPANWNPVMVPGPDDTAIFNSGAAVLATPVTVQGLALTGATLSGPAAGTTLTVTGAASWQSGTVGTGLSLIVQPGGTLDLFGSGQKQLLGTLINRGTGSWSAGDIRATGGVFTNEGTLTILGTSSRQFAQATAAPVRFENTGTLIKSGTHTMSFQFFSAVSPTLTVTNTGGVQVTGGLLAITVTNELGGTMDVSAGARLAIGRATILPGAIFTGAGQVELSAATCSAQFQMTGRLVTSQMAFPIATTIPCQVVHSGNVLILGGGMTITGSFEWSAGEIIGPGTLTLAPGATCTVQPVAGGPTRTLRTNLINNGVMNITTSGLFAEGGNISNNGVMNAAGATFSAFGGANPVTLFNTGTLNVSSAAGLRMDGPANGFRLVNTGQLNTNGSPLYLSGGSSNQTLDLGAATLEINGPFGFNVPVGVASASAVTLRGTGATGPGSITTQAMTIGAGSLVITSPIYAGSLLFQNGADTTFEGPVQVAGTTTPSGGNSIRLRAPLTTGSWGSTIQGTVTLEAPQTWGGFTSTGVITGPADLTIAPGTEVYLGGTLEGPGKIIVAPGAFGRRNGLGSVTTSRGIVNNGTFLWSGGTINLVGCSFENAGLMRIVPPSPGGVTLAATGGTCVFHNTGELRVQTSGSPAMSLVNSGGTLHFNQMGSVVLGDGAELRVMVATTSSGTYTHGSNSRLKFTDAATISAPLGSGLDGMVEFSTGSAAIATAPLNVRDVFITGGELTLEAPTSLWYLYMNNGRIAGSGNLELTGDSCFLYGQTIEGTGTLTFAANSRVSLPGNLVIRRNTVNLGTAALAGGPLTLQDATFTNAGEMVFTQTQPSAVFTFKGNAGARLINTGVITKSDPGRINFSAPGEPLLLSNPGRIDLSGGVLSIGDLEGYLPGSSLSQGTWNVSGASTLILPASSPCKNIGAAATVALTGSGPTFGAFGSLESIDGTLRLGQSTQLTVSPPSGLLTNRGQVALGVGSTLTVAGSFAQTSSGLLRVSMIGTAPGQFGRLAVSGTASLAGAVVIDAQAGFHTAACNASSVFITSSGMSGSFTATPPSVAGRVTRVNSGATAASVSIRNPADVATLGGSTPADGILTADDLIVFLQAFFAEDLAIADVAMLGGLFGPDGRLSPDDIIAFLNSYFAGCQ